jgi:hypothetical protein
VTAATTSPCLTDGWRLGAESWSFHRQFYARVGRPAAWREYTDILWQIRLGKAERLVDPILRRYWRVTLADGVKIVVVGGRSVLLGVEPADWSPPPTIPKLDRRAPRKPAPAKAAPDTAAKAGPKTLTPGNPKAAATLARLLGENA